MRFKRLAGVVAFLSVIGGSGLLVGAALAPTPVSATCENDECENSSQCKINSTTGCDVVVGGCKTYGCSQT